MDVIDPLQIIKLLAALAFVVALMGGFALLAKRLGLGENGSALGRKKRLRVVESLPVDSRRRLLLIQCDGKQHLVLTGNNGDTVIKTDIEPEAGEQDANERKAPTI